MPRRRVLAVLGSLLVAPAIVRAESLMPVSAAPWSGPLVFPNRPRLVHLKRHFDDTHHAWRVYAEGEDWGAMVMVDSWLASEAELRRAERAAVDMVLRRRL